MAGAVVSLVRVATYRREVGASLDRIWENVLDWEHLPWLHRETFARVDLRARGAWGWRAGVGLRGAPAAETLEIEVRLDRPGRAYDTTTVAGPGAGTVIRTGLDPVAAHRTRIRVDFDLPDVRGDVAAVGDAYVALYRRLWDEDEAMMRARQALLDGDAEPAERCVTLDGAVRRFRPVCPHLGGPLHDAPVDAEGCVTCPWHGYRFDLRTGRSADGRGLLLDGWKTG